MPLDPDKLLALDLPEHQFSYDERDTMLYALGIGFGHDPLDERELRFVYEKNLVAAPTMASVIGWDRSWIASTGLQWAKVVHGEERLTIHNPLPATAIVTSKAKVVDLVDKGKDKGAVLSMETAVRDDKGAPLFTRTTAFFARADGGFGGGSTIGRRKPACPHPAPDRAADVVVDLPTQPSQALLYRLSGDRNPLHSDPAVARAAGFERPILHGLCSYGLVCRAILTSFCDYDARRIRTFDVRFSSPVLPGETLRVELWRDGSQDGDSIVSYRASVVERGTLALNNGRVLLRG